MYKYMHTYIYIYIHVFIYTLIHIYIYNFYYGPGHGFLNHSYSTVHSNKLPVQFFQGTDSSHSGRCLGKQWLHFTACHRAAALPLGGRWLEMWVGREGTGQLIIWRMLVATTIVQNHGGYGWQIQFIKWGPLALFWISLEIYRFVVCVWKGWMGRVVVVNLRIMSMPFKHIWHLIFFLNIYVENVFMFGWTDWSPNNAFWVWFRQQEMVASVDLNIDIVRGNQNCSTSQCFGKGVRHHATLF